MLFITNPVEQAKQYLPSEATRLNKAMVKEY
jgi:hypothetical protein